MDTIPSTGTKTTAASRQPIKSGAYAHSRAALSKATCGNSWLVMATWATFGQRGHRGSESTRTASAVSLGMGYGILLQAVALFGNIAHASNRDAAELRAHLAAVRDGNLIEMAIVLAIMVAVLVAFVWLVRKAPPRK